MGGNIIDEFGGAKRTWLGRRKVKGNGRPGLDWLDRARLVGLNWAVNWGNSCIR